MKKIIKWILGERQIVVTKGEIEKILFHRGRMLLLDTVVISDGKAVGEFTVPAEICEGHEPIPGLLVMRGVEVVEMAFQFFGVFAAKNPELTNAAKGRVFVAREIINAKFSGLVSPGDKVILEARTDVDIEEVGLVARVTSCMMVAKVNGRKKASIAAVVLAGFDPLSIQQSL